MLRLARAARRTRSVPAVAAERPICPQAVRLSSLASTRFSAASAALLAAERNQQIPAPGDLAPGNPCQVHPTTRMPEWR